MTYNNIEQKADLYKIEFKNLFRLSKKLDIPINTLKDQITILMELKEGLLN